MKEIEQEMRVGGRGEPDLVLGGKRTEAPRASGKNGNKQP